MGQIYRDKFIASEYAVGDRETNRTVARTIKDEHGVITGYSAPAYVEFGTPVMGGESAVTIEAAEIALLVEGDTVLFDGESFVLATYPDADNEFSDAAGLATLIDALDGWAADVVSGGDIEITAEVTGAGFDGEIFSIYATADVTAGGNGTTTPASAELTAAELSVLEVGDGISFANQLFLKVASDAGATEFTNTAGLAALLDGITGWSASVDSSAGIDIIADDNAEASNGFPVVLVIRRLTDGGVTATAGVAGQMMTDGTNIYVCSAVDSETGDPTWKKVALSALS